MSNKRIIFYSLFFTALTLWVYFNCEWQLHKTIHFSENKFHQIKGVVDSLPTWQNHHLSFNIKLQSIDNVPAQGNIKLNWYGKTPYLHIGETWLLTVKLKAANSVQFKTENFNYGRWLQLNDLQAIGYVISNKPQKKLKNFTGWNIRYHVDQWRSNIATEIHQLLKKSHYQPETALISALTVGIRTSMTKAQWADFQNTNTVHLMAIAGLHIGFCAGFVFFIFNWLWSRSVTLMLLYPSQKAALIAALLAAFFYALMSGFALPAQRAFIMIAAVTLAKLSNRNISLTRGLGLAFVLILLWDPLAILTASFWFSFSAVSLIFYGVHGRIHLERTLWGRWGQIQWVLCLGLTPITLWFFQQSSLSGLLANLIAIPVVTFLGIPLCLSACILLSIDHHLAYVLFISAAFVLHYLLIFLHALAFFPHAVWHFSLNKVTQLAAMILAVLLLLAPKGLPVRWLGGLLLICVLLS